jgi:hypothetical protein
MTYQIQIAPSKQVEFLQIIESLHRLGVIEKYQRAESLVVPGEPVPLDALLQTLEESEQQIENGLSFSTAEAKVFLEAWKKRKM